VGKNNKDIQGEHEAALDKMENPELVLQQTIETCDACRVE
jgi:hypothetical protein